MNRQGQFQISWMIDFVSVIALTIVLLTGLLIFGLSGIKSPETTVLGSGLNDLKHTDVLLSYLQAPVSEKDMKMVQLIDLYAEEKGVWRRLLELETRAWIQSTAYGVSVGEKEGEGLRIGGGKELVTSIPIITSQEKTVWVSLYG